MPLPRDVSNPLVLAKTLKHLAYLRFANGSCVGGGAGVNAGQETLTVESSCDRVARAEGRCTSKENQQQMLAVGGR